MKTKRQIWFIQKGLILAFSLMLLLSSATTYADFHSPSFNEETKTAQSSDKKEKDKTTNEVSLTALEAIINVAHFEIHFESYLIKELLLISETSEGFYLSKAPTYNSRHFKTLFRLIIGPNAP